MTLVACQNDGWKGWLQVFNYKNSKIVTVNLQWVMQYKNCIKNYHKLLILHCDKKVWSVSVGSRSTKFRLFAGAGGSVLLLSLLWLTLFGLRRFRRFWKTWNFLLDLDDLEDFEDLPPPCGDDGFTGLDGFSGFCAKMNQHETKYK